MKPAIISTCISKYRISHKYQERMVTKYLLSTFVLLPLLSPLCSNYPLVLAIPTPSHDHSNHTSTPKREALGIVIGGGSIVIGGGTVTPSPTPPDNCHTPPPPPPTRLEIARRTIQEFKKRIEYDPKCVTKTWTGPDPCVYTGFKCAYLKAYNQQALFSVQFNGLGFAGSNLGIDNFIDKLPDISIFHANSNNFSGKIPDLTKLPYLFELDLSNNKYEGAFPSNLLGATNLTYFDIRFNKFSGRVPAQLFTLQVVALFINNNKFQQELPSNLGETPAAFLTLANNQFCGPIPKSIGQASETLLEVLFLNNKLSGCLPSEVGKLKMARVFDAEGNSLVGPIPNSYACLGNMQYLILARNQLQGCVPEFVCKLPKLTNLTLSNNYFTEVGPKCRELIKRKVLDVSHNCIPGLPNQRPAQECEKFLCKPKPTCPQAQQIPCMGTAPYLTSELPVVPPRLQPTLTYSSLAPGSN